MNEYTTLTKVRRYLSLGSAQTTDDDILRVFMRDSSQAIEKLAMRHFYPDRRTLKFDHPEDGDLLRIRDDVLEVFGLSDMGGASEIDTAAYVLKCGEDYNLTPYNRLLLKDNSGSAFKISGTEIQSVHMDAAVGYHERYDNAWVNSGASLTDALGVAIVSASVSGSAGRNTLGLSPRFDTETLIRVDSEYMYIYEGGDGASTFNVLRGVNGSTAASHAASATVEVFAVEPDIEFAARRLTAWLYHQSLDPYTGTILDFGGALPTLEVPENWPGDVLNRLSRFKKQIVASEKLTTSK